MPETEAVELSRPSELRANKSLVTADDFCRFEQLTRRALEKRRLKGKLTVISGPVGRNGKPVPMISIDQLSPAGLARWVAEQTAKHRAAFEATQTLKGTTPSACGHSPFNAAQGGELSGDRRQVDRREMDRDRAALWGRYERAKNPQKEEASRRLAALQAVESLVASGIGRVQAIDTVAAQMSTNAQALTPSASGHSPLIAAQGGEQKVSRVTLYRWFELVNLVAPADRLPALLPRYAGCQVQAECSVEAWDYFKADYLRLEKPAASACYERLQRIAAERGWTVPSVETLLNRIRREIPHQVLVLARSGPQELKRSYPAQQRDRAVFHALEAVNADGHEFDLRVLFPDGEERRPQACFWQDLFSGKLLAYRVDKTSNKDMVRLAAGDMVERYGIPSEVYFDNGREFASKWLTGGMEHRFRFKVKPEEPAGIFGQLGCQIHWCTPYWGQAKPIERAFRDLCETVAKHPLFTGAYTGNNPVNKPANYGSRVIPLKEFLAVLETEVVAHNARAKRRSAVCAGQFSFDQVFDRSYAASPIRKATPEQRRLWLLAVEGVAASRQDGSIHICGNRFWAEFLSQHAGERLVARFDPQAPRAGLHVETVSGIYLGQAECIAAVGFNDTEAAREHARLRNENVRKQKVILANERRMTALEAAEMLPQLDTPEQPAAKVVRPYFSQVASGEELEVREEEPADERFGKAVELMRAEFEKRMAERV